MTTLGYHGETGRMENVTMISLFGTEELDDCEQNESVVQPFLLWLSTEHNDRTGTSYWVILSHVDVIHPVAALIQISERGRSSTSERPNDFAIFEYSRQLKRHD